MFADHLLALPQRQRLARFFALLADPTRLQILNVLQQAPDGMSVTQITAATAVKQAAISKNLRLLSDHGLLGCHRQGTYRYYYVSDPLVLSICELVCGRLSPAGQS